MMARATTTKTTEKPADVADQAESKGEVAIFHAARLPYHPAIEERFGVDKGQWKVLVEAIFPAAKSVDAIVMALTYCKSRNLDPFKRPVHIVPMWDSGRGEYVETIWPGISELRTTASRTKGYAGCDVAEFGGLVEMEFTGRVKDRGNWIEKTISVEFPEWCRMTVYRIVGNERCKFVGPKVAWLETYAKQGASELPNKMWKERPEGQLEKCAEAAALRRAFPEEIGNELTAEEMTGKSLHELSMEVTSAATEAAAAPQNRDAGPPRQVTGPKEPPHDLEQARDGTPPPRQTKAAPKEDPITTGPQRTVDPGPSEGPPKPRRVPGSGKGYDEWAEEYIDLIKTSPDIATVYSWIDMNTKQFRTKEDGPLLDGPLTRLNKGKPSVYATVKKATEQTMEKLRDEAAKAAERAKKKAAPAPSDMDEQDQGGDMDDGPGETKSDPDVPRNPEDILAAIDRELAAVEDADQLQDVWEKACEPLVKALSFPPDVDEAQALFDKHSKRLGGD